MSDLEFIKQEIQDIKQRNKRVELDKAWEVSLARKIIILILTYFIVLIIFITAQIPRPFINSVVPTAAFAISTSSLSFFKKFWLKNKV